MGCDDFMGTDWALMAWENEGGALATGTTETERQMSEPASCCPKCGGSTRAVPYRGDLIADICTTCTDRELGLIDEAGVSSGGDISREEADDDLIRLLEA